MAAPASTSPLAPVPPDWPDSGSNDVLRTLFLQCVDAYKAEAGNDVDWALVARASAAMLRRSRREWIWFLLRSRATHGEFHQLVRDMRLDDGSDFFRYFRMTRQRFDHLLSLVGASSAEGGDFLQGAHKPCRTFVVHNPSSSGSCNYVSFVSACRKRILHSRLRFTCPRNSIYRKTSSKFYVLDPSLLSSQKSRHPSCCLWFVRCRGASLKRTLPAACLRVSTLSVPASLLLPRFFNDCRQSRILLSPALRRGALVCSLPGEQWDWLRGLWLPLNHGWYWRRQQGRRVPEDSCRFSSSQYGCWGWTTGMGRGPAIISAYVGASGIGMGHPHINQLPHQLEHIASSKGIDPQSDPSGSGSAARESATGGGAAGSNECAVQLTLVPGGFTAVPAGDREAAAAGGSESPAGDGVHRKG
ncbi:hypothetical protein HPB47_015019 [Ixodes persulcatus]|uniref:Uncharacterized protein n=1 Tax=Ixodes persulcatus TaxID=34615 RepID=A0AC60QVS4_IXOPE|nr:hypothetical protein HPB47_015019 [Ixodes persulcatus]